MNNYSKPTIADKLTKAGIIIGIGVAALMFIGLLLSNITHLDAWILISGIVGSGLIGAFVGGILWVIGFVLGGTMDAKDRMVQKNLSGKYNKINAELQQINQEIGKIEPRKKENDATCASIDHLEREMEALRHKLYSNTNKVQ